LREAMKHSSLLRLRS